MRFRYPIIHNPEVQANFEQLEDELNDTKWTPLVLKNSWKNFVGEAGYRIKSGVVYIRAIISGGAANTTVTVLPQEAWPSQDVGSGASADVVFLTTSGELKVSFTGSPSSVAINFSYPL